MLGFELRLIYVYLRSAELQIERIKLRVAKGGHDVPDAKVRERRERSFDQLPWFFAQADAAWIFDNSGAQPELVGKKESGTGWLSTDMSAELLRRFT